MKYNDFFFWKKIIHVAIIDIYFDFVSSKMYKGGDFFNTSMTLILKTNHLSNSL